EHPLITKDSTVYTEDALDTIFISTSSIAGLLIFRPDDMSMQFTPLPKIVDIRSVHHGIVIVADKMDQSLWAFKLDDRLWKSKSMLCEEICKMESAMEVIDGLVEKAKQTEKENENLRRQLEEAGTRQAFPTVSDVTEKKYRRMLLMFGRSNM
ncbi:hypothetical protein PFISCL1PPCAC_10834, partial [Pristionchus fissidentatus]